MTSSNRKRILITGASSGIGQAAAAQLASAGHKVTITVRDEEKAVTTRNIFIKKGLDVESFVMDLSIWASVQAGIEDIKKRQQQFDIVIFNAGTMFPEKPTTTDGLDTCLQVNVLSHVFLAESLLQLRPPDHHIHFVCVSSVLFNKKCNHRLCGPSWPLWRVPRDGRKWREVFAPRNVSGWRAYALSKFAITLLASQLNQMEGVTAVAVNPGNTVTNVSRNMPPRQRKLLRLFKNSLITVEQAGSNVVRGALRPLPAGQFYDQHSPSALPKPLTSEKNMLSLQQLNQQLIEELIHK
uniref:SDR family NAD(P)-dependent oxidoreductase n=1 Tax=Heterorhabditis bacteriophora TaxID=37862 RepID=A0A1I7XS83_HETBA